VKVAEVQNMARHVLRITLVLQHVAAVRAALESAVQLGQSNRVHRQAGMATLRNVGMRYSCKHLPPVPPAGQTFVTCAEA
jgi:hypothetical protein